MTSRTPARSSSLVRWLTAVLLLFAILIHVPTLDQPLVERHNFRQTQTAFTARIYHEDGIDLLHPRLPVLGPPWEVPFEFPLFQAAASLVMDVGVAEDRAMRVTGFASFLLAAALLWLLVRRQVGGVGAVTALAVFTLSPLAIEWSRAALIEYLALAASLGFALAGLHWRDQRSRRWFAIAMLLGCIAALVKITTALFWLAPFALLGLGRDDQAQTARSRMAAWVLSLGPILVGVAWTRYADAIKAASSATAWLTSSALVSWNFGDLPQRLDQSAWERTLGSVLVLAGGVVLPLLIIPIVRFALTRHQVRFVAWIAVTLAGPVLLFFNLYFQHDYYAMATSASVAILVAIGVVGLVDMRSRVAQGALAGVVVIMVAVWVVNIGYWTRIYEPISDPEGILPLAEQIERETSPGQYVAILGRDWSPSVLYYAHRWGWMLREGDSPSGTVARLLSEGWAVYRCPFVNERDYCDRVTTAGVPVGGDTFGAGLGGPGLVQSAP